MYDSTGEFISSGSFEYEQTIQFDGDMVVYARLEPSADILDISFVAQNIDIANDRISRVDDKINSVEEAIYDKINSVEDKISSLEEDIHGLILSAEDFAYGILQVSGNIVWSDSNKIRIATINKYPVKEGDTLKSLSSNVKLLPIMYDSTGEFISSGSFEYEQTIQFDGDMVVYARLEPSANILDISFVAQNIIILSKLAVVEDKVNSLYDKVNSLDDKVNSVIDTGTVIVSNDEVYLGAKKFLLWNPYKEIPASPIKIDGQLHVHTNQSDGGETAETVASKIADSNYKFFWTITDHNRVTPKPSNNDSLGLIWLGESYESTDQRAGTQHLCVYMGELETYDSTGLSLGQGDNNLFGVVSLYNLNKSMNEIIEHYTTTGNLINYAHPFWDR